MPYQDTFIQIAPDSEAESGQVPTSNRAKTPAHIIQFELLSERPYTYTHRELVFAVYCRQKEIPADVVAANKEELWNELFQKEHPCLRASSLTKKFGWGAHYNTDGKIALYGVETDEYKRFAEMEAPDMKQLLAMRSKRKK